MSRRETALRYFLEQEEYMNSRVSAGIEENRKAQTIVFFEDKDGNPIKNVTFCAKQKTHDFNFGCNIFLLDEFGNEEKNKMYRDIYAKSFNYATVPFYWGALEPEKGKPRYAKDSYKLYRRPAPDLVVDYCKENNIRMKGHCLVYDAYRPEWLTEDVGEMKYEIEKHFAEVSARYKDDIRDWDILNEILSWNVYMYHRITRFFRAEDYVRFCFDCAKRYFPVNRKFINEAEGIWEEFRFTRTPYYMLLENELMKGTEFDAIGIQCHEFVDKKDEGNFAEVRMNPVRIYNLLDTFGKLGKPIHISEVTLCAYDNSEENQAIQAQMIENLYKIWFSHKSMDGIIYWNLIDGYTYLPPKEGTKPDLNSVESQYGGGLLNFDFTPKPAYKTLQRLINEEWHTEGKFNTIADSNRAVFRGFKGMYEITTEYNGKKYTRQLHIDGNEDWENKIVLD